MTAEPAIDLDPALRALADRNRRAILQAIRTEPHQVGAVAAERRQSQQIAKHHHGGKRRAGRAPGGAGGERSQRRAAAGCRPAARHRAAPQPRAHQV